MQHIIKKQIIDLTLDNKLDCFHIQEIISRQYREFIVPVLEKTFDKTGFENDIIEIDKLVIDLGVMTENTIIQNEWISGFHVKLEKLLEGIKNPASEIRHMHRPKALSVFRQWLFYMQKGYLPWNVLKPDEQWYRSVLEALASDHDSISELRDLMRTDATLVKRISVQHNETFFINLVETLTAQKQDVLIFVFQELHTANESIKSTVESKISNLFRDMLSSLRIEILRAAASESKLAPGFARLIIKNFLITRKLTPVMFSKVAARLTFINDFPEIASSLHGKQPEKEIMNLISPQLLPAIDEEGIFVFNAGVVLLHPFMNNFFKRLNLVRDGKFFDLARQQKAMNLLHFLATGNPKPEEHELVIAKILCSFPLEETLETEFNLSKKEKKEALDLLMAAIIQWEKLKNTSAAGLREGFLQRSGKLFSRDGKLYLQVETSSIDVLLDHLPWNLGMVKLPWMEDILRVDWR